MARTNVEKEIIRKAHEEHKHGLVNKIVYGKVKLMNLVKLTGHTMIFECDSCKERIVYDKRTMNIRKPIKKHGK